VPLREAPADRRPSGALAGVLGFTAKGAAYAVVGILVVAAAVTYDLSKSRGLDMALRTVAAQPYGRALLLAVAAGVAAYGFFAFAEARHHAIWYGAAVCRLPTWR